MKWIIIIGVFIGILIMGCQPVAEVTSDIVETEVTTVRVEKLCPECKSGKMEMSNGGVLTSYPAQYPHQCTECGYSQYYSGVIYPCIEYRS